MKTQQHWEEFAKSGKIEDYLDYKGRNQISNKVEGNNKIEKQVGDSPYAGFSSNNRNDIKHDSYR